MPWKNENIATSNQMRKIQWSQSSTIEGGRQVREKVGTTRTTKASAGKGGRKGGNGGKAWGTELL